MGRMLGGFTAEVLSSTPARGGSFARRGSPPSLSRFVDPRADPRCRHSTVDPAGCRGARPPLGPFTWATTPPDLAHPLAQSLGERCWTDTGKRTIAIPDGCRAPRRTSHLMPSSSPTLITVSSRSTFASARNADSVRTVIESYSTNYRRILTVLCSQLLDEGHEKLP